jgi:short-subunit dehydrogenase
VVALSAALVQDLSLRRARVGVSVLCPGWVATRLLESAPGADPVLQALVAHGRRAEEIADRTVNAVRSGEFYVLTHPEMAPAVLRRADDILKGRPPKPMPFRLSRSREE